MDAQLRLIPRGKTSTSESRTTRPVGAQRSDRAEAAASRRPDLATPVEAAEAPIQWRIDDSARQRGRAGISRAREALRQAHRRLPHQAHTTAA